MVLNYIKGRKGVNRISKGIKFIGLIIAFCMFTSCNFNGDLKEIKSENFSAVKPYAPNKKEVLPFDKFNNLPPKNSIQSILINNLCDVELVSFYNSNVLSLRVLVTQDWPKLALYVQNCSIPLTKLDSYALPPFNIYEKYMDMAYEDITNDGLPDLVIIASFATGISKTGSIPYPRALIYTGTKDGFRLDIDLIEQVQLNYSNSYDNINELVTWFNNK